MLRGVVLSPFHVAELRHARTLDVAAEEVAAQHMLRGCTMSNLPNIFNVVVHPLHLTVARKYRFLFKVGK